MLQRDHAGNDVVAEMSRTCTRWRCATTASAGMARSCRSSLPGTGNTIAPRYCASIYTWRRFEQSSRCAGCRSSHAFSARKYTDRLRRPKKGSVEAWYRCSPTSAACIAQVLKYLRQIAVITPYAQFRFRYTAQDDRHSVAITFVRRTLKMPVPPAVRCCRSRAALTLWQLPRTRHRRSAEAGCMLSSAVGASLWNQDSLQTVQHTGTWHGARSSSGLQASSLIVEPGYAPPCDREPCCA